MGAKAVSNAVVLPVPLCYAADGDAALLRCKICAGCRAAEQLALLVRSQRLLLSSA